MKLEYLRDDCNSTAHIVKMYPNERDWDKLHDWLRRTAERITLLEQEATRDLAAAREELAAANATVEERPIVGTTGDGVSVRVGQPIYRATPTHIETGYAQADGSVGGPKMWACSVGMYYSTRTAAEAAREGKP